MNTNNYVEKSLELHQFFARIMKEHSLFIRASLTPVNAMFSDKAEFYKNEFDKLLCKAVTLGNGIISDNVLHSQELVTEFTVLAEKQTERFTGIKINKNITERQLRYKSGHKNCTDSTEMCRNVRQLNQTALSLLDGLICFKETILKKVLCCEMYTANYPLLLEHTIGEAKVYRDYIKTLENEGCLTDLSMKNTECFWNQIMMEHAMFIRGQLDPTETELFDTADNFAQEYSELLSACHGAQNRMLSNASLETTLKFRDFKRAGTQGIQQCKIRSVILPLLADHVLREANHYIRLLNS